MKPKKKQVYPEMITRPLFSSLAISEWHIEFSKLPPMSKHLKYLLDEITEIIYDGTEMACVSEIAHETERALKKTILKNNEPYSPASQLADFYLSKKGKDWFSRSPLNDKCGPAGGVACYALLCFDRGVGQIVAGNTNAAIPHLMNAAAAAAVARFLTMVLWMEIQDYERRTEFAKSGANAKNKKIRLLRRWTVRQYKSGNWKSAHAASHALLPRAVEKAKTMGIRLSFMRGQKTIYEWLLNKPGRVPADG